MIVSEERDNDPETPTTRASVGSPGFVPPVIFAGLSSPNAAARSASEMRFKEGLKASKMRETTVRSRDTQDVSMEGCQVQRSAKSRSLTPVNRVYRSSTVDSDMAVESFNGSPFPDSPRSNFTREGSSAPYREHTEPRNSYTSCMSSCRLITPRLPRSVRTEESHASLSNQIADLEAALSHSKAREKMLFESHQEVLNQLNAKDDILKQQKASIEALEQENRQTKANVRDLMDATLASCSINSSSTENSQQLCPIDVLNEAEQKVDEHISKHKTKGKRNWLSLLTGRQSHDGDHATENEISIEETQLREELFEAKEIVKALKGTNIYVQKVLQRNSELELRCKQLEGDNDEKVRSLHQELNSTRRDRNAADADVTQKNRIVEQQKEELLTLHSELREMHEKQRLHRVVVHELHDAREEIEFLRDALAGEKTEVQKLAIEWEQEKCLLQADLAFEKKKSTSCNVNAEKDNPSSTFCVLALRISELEGVIAQTRQELSDTLSASEEKKAELQKKLRKLTQQLDTSKRREREMENLKGALESELNSTRDRLTTLQRTVASFREHNASLLEQVAELDDVKASLSSARDQLNTQAKQIDRHVQAIREANERYGQLLESKSVLDCLLHTKQKEKEDSVAEAVKTHGQLYDQSNVYRQRLESATKEIAMLKKQLTEKEESVKNALDVTEVARLKEIRQLKESVNTVKRQAALEFEKKISELRESYEKELQSLRQQKDEKMDSLVTRYEKYIKELKAMQENKIKSIVKGKEDEVKKCTNDMMKRVAEIQALMKERLAKQRALHEEELNTVQLTHNTSLQAQLQNRCEEIEELRAQLASLKKESEERVNLAEQQALKATALLNQYKTHEAEAENDRDASYTTLLNERDALQNSIAELIARSTEKQKEIEETHTEAMDTLQHELETMQSRYEESCLQLDSLRKKLGDIQTDNARLRGTVEEFQTQLEQRALISDGTEGSQSIAHNGTSDVDASTASKKNDAQVIEELERKLELTELLKQQLEERLTYDTTVLQKKLQEKEERLQSLLPMQLHVSKILSQNSELEDMLAKESKRFSDLMNEKTSELVAFEAKITRMDHVVKEQELEITTLKADAASLEAQCKHLHHIADREKEAQETIVLQQHRIDELSAKVDELTVTLSNLKDTDAKGERRIAVKQEADEISRECIRTMKQLVEDLSKKQEENLRLCDEIDKLQYSSKEFSRLKLECTLQTQRIESQEETLSMLRERLQGKQALIDELSEKFRSDDLKDQENTTRATDTTKLTQMETQLHDLNRKCLQLEDEKSHYEHERRAVEHRLELEQQLLLQCIEQKERQMKHLIETNKRAEALFVRNAELEALLYTLQLEKETHRCSESKGLSSVSTSRSDVDSQTTLSELEVLRATLNEKDARITKLMEELRVSKNLYTKEIETLTTRLHFASLEQSLVPLSTEDDLLRLLVEKTTELQQEVKRLQQERDENARRSPGLSGRRSIDGHHPDDVVVNLQLRVETLLAEREHLRKQVSELVSSSDIMKKTSMDIGALTSKEDPHGLSLKCRLELLFQRLRKLVDVSTVDTESSSFSVKEVSILTLELEKILTEMGAVTDLQGETATVYNRKEDETAKQIAITSENETKDSSTTIRKSIYPSLFTTITRCSQEIGVTGDISTECTEEPSLETFEDAMTPNRETQLADERNRRSKRARPTASPISMKQVRRSTTSQDRH